MREDFLMAKLLVIKAHPHVEKSTSITVGDYFIEQYKKFHPEDKIIVRDLYAAPVPPINNTTVQAWKHQRQNQPLTNEEQQLISEHNQWLQEFMDADKFVFVNPMYNLFIPAEMKQYIDVIAVPRKTFKYTEHGPVGLLHNKKILHIQSAGNVYHGTPLEKYDIGNQYLRGVAMLCGITDFTSIYVEGIDKNPAERDTIIKEAEKEAQSIAKDF